MSVKAKVVKEKAKGTKAKKPAVKFTAEQLRELETLSKLLSEMQRNLWAIGDEVNRLKTIGFKIRQLENHFNLKANRLSEMRATAEEFKPSDRIANASFSHYELARKASKKFGKDIGKSAPAVREYITKNKLHTPRKVMIAIAEIRRQKEDRDSIREAAKRLAGDKNNIINRCFHSPFQNILSEVKDGSIKIINADPPFGNYTKLVDGALDHSTATCRTDCDNKYGQPALDQTLDILKLGKAKLALDGVILLWQSSMPLREEFSQQYILQKFELEVHREAWWDKGQGKLEDPEDGYSSQSERCLILCHPGAKLRNHAPSSGKGNIFRFSPVKFKADKFHDHHQFEKPEDLMELFFSKHSYTGDLIFSAFGCSGVDAVVAQKMGRQWIYCESNKNNYEFGSERIAKDLEALKATA